MIEDKIPISTRLGCAFADFWITCFIFGILSIVIRHIINLISGNNYEKSLDIAFSYFIAFIVLNKDIFNGQSFMKSILGLQVVDKKTGNVASELHCAIRNTTMLLWPIEAVVLLFSPTRRLGDLIAGTKLIAVERRSSKQWLANVKSKKFSSSSAIALLFGVSFVIFLWFLVRNFT